MKPVVGRTGDLRGFALENGLELEVLNAAVSSCEQLPLAPQLPLFKAVHGMTDGFEGALKHDASQQGLEVAYYFHGQESTDIALLALVQLSAQRIGEVEGMLAEGMLESYRLRAEGAGVSVPKYLEQ